MKHPDFQNTTEANTSPRRDFNLRILGIGLTLSIFLVDAFVSTPLDVEFLYSVVLLMTIWLNGMRVSFDASIGITCLVIVGYFVSSKRLESDHEISSRVISILVVGASAYAILLYKQSKEMAFRTEERLSAMFENATEGIIVTNQKGQIIMCNPRARTQFRYEKSDLINKPIEILIPDRFSGQHSRHRKDFYQRPHTRPMGLGMKLSAKRKDGSEFPVEVSLSFFKVREETYVISFIIDITERTKQEELLKLAKEELELRVKERTQELAKANYSLAEANATLKIEMRERIKMEDALRDSERLYSTIARNFPDGIIAVLNKNLEYIFVDGKELKEIAYSSDQFLGRKVDDIFFSENRGLSELLSKVFDWQNVSFEATFKSREYFVNAVPLPDAKGIIREILLVIQDTTEQKKAEKEILMALQKEKELNDLKSKFITTASHEFRTPLSTILSSTSLIERYMAPEDSGKRARHIDRIKSSVKNLTEILNDFLSLEKLEAGKIEVHLSTFILDAFIEDLREEMMMAAKPGQRIIYQRRGTSNEVTLDKQQMRNVLINLINNAIKYSEEGKVITIESRVGEKEVQITVKDEGIGIAPEDQVHLFERFFRAQNVIGIQGTGLGLNIVQRYLKLMGGQIKFISEINKGSIFTVTFPVIKPKI